MKVVLRLVLTIFLCATAIILFQAARIFLISDKTDYTNKPFEKNYSNSSLKFLFLGDSTAVGTGTKDGSDSVAGWFSKEYQRASIANYSRNGKRLKELSEDFYPKVNNGFDLVVMQIGANDILHFTPYPEIEKDLKVAITKAKKLSKNVVILHSGNVGLAPIFIFPFDLIYAERSRKVRAIYMKAAKEYSVIYVDLYSERADDLFLKDIEKYYSPDHLHPSGEGYHWWYSRIRANMKRAGVNL